MLRIRDAHPVWGPRKISARLTAEGVDAPAPATVTAVLRRHGRLGTPVPHLPVVRFEAEAPNDLWQMDHKGDIILGDGSRCFPLTVLDDHSRFSLCVHGQTHRRRGPVKDQLTALFRRYGLPQRLLCDNGRPWGGAHRRTDIDGRSWPYYTRLATWMMRLGITLVRIRPYHPQIVEVEVRNPVGPGDADGPER